MSKCSREHLGTGRGVGDSHLHLVHAATVHRELDETAPDEVAAIQATTLPSARQCPTITLIHSFHCSEMTPDPFAGSTDVIA